MKRIFLLIAPIIMSCSFFGIGLALAGNAQKESEPPSPTSAQLREAYGKLPLSFEANHGQTDSQVKFLSRRPGFTLYLKPTEAVLVFMATPAALPEADTQRVVRMQLLGANPSTSMTGLEQLPGRVNYFIGNNPHQWRTNLPTYAKLKYDPAYPGIDLHK
jgi:hypothetical protein